MRAPLRLLALFLVLAAIFSAIGWLLGGYFFGNWLVGALLFLVLAAAMNLISYFYAHKIVLWSYRAKIVTEDEQPRLFRAVRRAAESSGLPMPKVALVPSKTPNAFATGRNPRNAVVAATEGILDILDDQELTAVFAHEMAHVKDRDILVMSVAATLAGAIAFMARMFWMQMWFGGSRRRESNGSDLLMIAVIAITAPIAAALVQLAISRSREYKADRVGATNLGVPDSLAKALLKLEAANERRPIQRGNPASASLFIVNPFRGSSFARIFSTHPSVESRIHRLEQLAAEMGRPWHVTSAFA